MLYGTAGVMSGPLDNGRPEVLRQPMLDPVLIGVDIGSVSIAIALLDSEREVQRFEYRPHRGKVRETLESILD